MNPTTEEWKAMAKVAAQKANEDQRAMTTNPNHMPIVIIKDEPPTPDSVLGKLQGDPEYKKLLKEEREKLDKELPMSYGFVALPNSWQKDFADRFYVARIGTPPNPAGALEEAIKFISDLLAEEREKTALQIAEVLRDAKEVHSLSFHNNMLNIAYGLEHPSLAPPPHNI